VIRLRQISDGLDFFLKIKKFSVNTETLGIIYILKRTKKLYTFVSFQDVFQQGPVPYITRLRWLVVNKGEFPRQELCCEKALDRVEK
jgi:hypothetical protein